MLQENASRADACDLGKNHLSGSCVSRDEFLATGLGDNGNRWPRSFLEGRCDPTPPLTMCCKRKYPVALFVIRDFPLFSS